MRDGWGYGGERRGRHSNGDDAIDVVDLDSQHPQHSWPTHHRSSLHFSHPGDHRCRSPTRSHQNESVRYQTTRRARIPTRVGQSWRGGCYRPNYQSRYQCRRDHTSGQIVGGGTVRSQPNWGNIRGHQEENGCYEDSPRLRGYEQFDVRMSSWKPVTYPDSEAGHMETRKATAAQANWENALRRRGSAGPLLQNRNFHGGSHVHLCDSRAQDIGRRSMFSQQTRRRETGELIYDSTIRKAFSGTITEDVDWDDDKQVGAHDGGPSINSQGPNVLDQRVKAGNADCGEVEARLLQANTCADTDEASDEKAGTKEGKTPDASVGSETTKEDVAEGDSIASFGESDTKTVPISEDGTGEGPSTVAAHYSRYPNWGSVFSRKRPNRVEDAYHSVEVTILDSQGTSKRKSRLSRSKRLKVGGSVPTNVAYRKKLMYESLAGSSSPTNFAQRQKKSCLEVGENNCQVVELEKGSSERAVSKRCSSSDEEITRPRSAQQVRREAKPVVIETLSPTPPRKPLLEIEKDTPKEGAVRDDVLLYESCFVASTVPKAEGDAKSTEGVLPQGCVVEIGESASKDVGQGTAVVDFSSGDESDMMFEQNRPLSCDSDFDRDRLNARIKDCTDLGIGDLSLPGQGLEGQHLLEILPSVTHQKFARINLNYNRLSMIPRPFTSFLGRQAVFKLVLRGNRLREFPLSILTLSSLEMLDLSCNRLVTVPEDLGALTKLRSLNLSSNSIRKLPSSTMSKLTNLEVLLLGYNRLRRLPSDLGNIKSLIALDLVHNDPFRWGLPKGVTENWTSIVSIKVEYTKLYERMPRRMRKLNARELCKQLEGLVPSQVKRLTRRRISSVADIVKTRSLAPSRKRILVQGGAQREDDAVEIEKEVVQSRMDVESMRREDKAKVGLGANHNGVQEIQEVDVGESKKEA